MAATTTATSLAPSLSLLKPTTQPRQQHLYQPPDLSLSLFSLLSLSSSPSTPPSPITLTKTTHEPLLPCDSLSSLSSDLISVLCPSLAIASTMFFKSAYNVQVIVGENEPEEKLINRFRREVLKAGVIQECKRRRFFETSQERKKRKARDAARRNRKRRVQAQAPKNDAREANNQKKGDEEDDNWEFYDVELPYCPKV